MRVPLIISLLLFMSCLAAAQEWGNSVIIEDVQIQGNKFTKYHIILRELSVRPCEVVPWDSVSALLAQNRQRLVNTGLFNEIHFSVDTLTSHGIRLNVAVKERWYIWPEVSFQLADRNFNVWWTEMNRDLRRTIIGLNLAHRNFRGNMERLDVGGQFGYSNKVSINYVKPYIDKSQKHGIGFGFSYQSNAETFYKTDSNKLRFARSYDRPMLQIMEGYLSYQYRPRYHAFHVLKAGWKAVIPDDSILHLNQEYLSNQSKRLQFLIFAYRLEDNHTDNWIYPLRGNKTIVNANAFIGIQGVPYQAYATLEHGQYRWLRNKWYASFIFRGRLMAPQAAPYALRSALGGRYDYVRGYELYVIDGYQYGVLRANLKRELLNKANILRLPFKYLPVVPLRLYPKLFADVGYVTNPHPGNSFLNNRLLYSAGIGMDVVTIYDIKVRLEYAMNHLGQHGLYLNLFSE